MIKTVSLFSGIGGLDLGFIQEGFNIIWANDNSPSTWKTYEHNHPLTVLDKRSIANIPSMDIPDCDLIIGGPPCQSWSAAGGNRGASDPRGRLFNEYLRIIRDKQPKVFVAENVEGILRKTHQIAFKDIIDNFKKIGYTVHYEKLNASDYHVPQDRVRVIIVGVKTGTFKYPAKQPSKIFIADAIGDLKHLSISASKRTDRINNNIACYLDDSWSSQYMSRNRVRSWNEVSYTIPATGRHIPIHPQAPKMLNTDRDVYSFVDDDGSYNYNGDGLYRRFTIQECARIQTFPDDYKLFFDRIDDGYKILGNAVPVKLAQYIAISVKDAFNRRHLGVPISISPNKIKIKITKKS